MITTELELTGETITQASVQRFYYSLFGAVAL